MAQATQKHHRPTHQRRAVVFDPKAEIDALIIEPSLVPDLSFLGSVERASSVESPIAVEAGKGAADNTGLATSPATLWSHRARLKETGLTDEEIRRVIDPMESFYLQFKEEVESYERLKRGEFEELDNLRGLGHLLIALRIAQSVSQRELAKRLEVHESQVSRDERNEYFGVTLERAGRILEALNVRLRTRVEVEPSKELISA